MPSSYRVVCPARPGYSTTGVSTQQGQTPGRVRARNNLSRLPISRVCSLSCSGLALTEFSSSSMLPRPQHHAHSAIYAA
ncbi:hypothetical protein ElyMa_006496700 [Elysia marginata]|uniref:Uncharacterized protein n=1 Tax=Elysia marginata TaxID=1093978 RepID=A0AAV4I5X2_9GAST|nr:hypothetical protein ElyMa_006496700 [Elysia marginata]